MRIRKLITPEEALQGLGEVGEPKFGQGLADFYIDEPAAVALAAQTRLKEVLGEWYMNTSDGTDYDAILGFGKEGTTRDQAITDIIYGTTGIVAGAEQKVVLDIQDYSSVLDRDARTLAVSCTLDTVYGTIRFEPTPFLISR